jgi:hypothetical protein
MRKYGRTYITASFTVSGSSISSSFADVSILKFSGSVNVISSSDQPYELIIDVPGGDSFPFTGSASITGSLDLIGPFTSSGDISSSGEIFGSTGSFDIIQGGTF